MAPHGKKQQADAPPGKKQQAEASPVPTTQPPAPTDLMQLIQFLEDRRRADEDRRRADDAQRREVFRDLLNAITKLRTTPTAPQPSALGSPPPRPQPVKAVINPRHLSFPMSTSRHFGSGEGSGRTMLP